MNKFLVPDDVANNVSQGIDAETSAGGDDVVDDAIVGVSS